MPRDIEDVLHFREDISPFLIHFTRTREGRPAKENLTSIVKTRTLRQSEHPISDARFAIRTFNIPDVQRPRFLSAICFTETPLGEAHCLFEISNRNVNLDPYGLVFLKERLKVRGVGPVFYVNNYNGDKAPLLREIGEMWQGSPEVAEKLIPMLALCGNRITPPGVALAQTGVVDFLWEREWRFPHCYGNLTFEPDDVFCGLCPEEEVDEFEALLPGVGFIDPRRNMKWFAKKLIDARQRLNLKTSVV